MICIIFFCPGDEHNDGRLIPIAGFFFLRLLFSDVHGRSHKTAGQTEDILAEATAMGSGLYVLFHRLTLLYRIAEITHHWSHERKREVKSDMRWVN
jgi:hypothetical protein